MWVTYLCVFIGAAIGGVGRYSLSGAVANWIGATFPWGTLIVNVTGCFVIGVFNTLTGPDGVFLVPGNLRVFVMWDLRRVHDVFFVQPGDAKPRAKRGVVRQRGVYTGINRVLPDRRLVGPCRGHSDQSLTRTLMDGADDAGGRESSIAAYLHRRK